MLARTIQSYLDCGANSYVIVELPLRDEATQEMGQQLRRELDGQGFDLLQYGEESGYDDWEENGEMAKVKCWWGIWQRRRN